MNFEKKYSFSDGNQIWRILISDSGKMIIETRDTEKKEVFFKCINLYTGDVILNKIDLDEKFWIGIEKIYKDVIFFHKFTKPDMPGHREIIAFDINSQKIIWRSNEYTFLFIYNDLVYVLKEKIEGNKYYALEYNSGEIIDEINPEITDLNYLRNLAEDNISYDDYIFTEKYVEDSCEDSIVKNLIKNETEGLDIVGDIEYTKFNKYLLFNFHSKVLENSLVNKFFVKNLETGEELFSDILNSNTNAFAPDSFFCYKAHVIVLKEKKEVIVYKLN